MEPLDRSTVWPYDERGEISGFYYQRYSHPTGAAAERALGELEAGEALLFGSGTAAITACVLGLMQPGATVALAEGAYFGTGVTLREFEPWGLKVVEFDQAGPPPAGEFLDCLPSESGMPLLASVRASLLFAAVTVSAAQSPPQKDRYAAHIAGTSVDELRNACSRTG